MMEIINEKHKVGRDLQDHPAPPTWRRAAGPTSLIPEDSGILSWDDTKWIHQTPPLLLPGREKSSWGQQKALLLLLVSLLHGENSKFKISSGKQDPMVFPESVDRAHWSHTPKEFNPSNKILRKLNNFKSFG